VLNFHAQAFGLDLNFIRFWVVARGFQLPPTLVLQNTTARGVKNAPPPLAFEFEVEYSSSPGFGALKKIQSCMALILMCFHS
jgi:hypothetical protein